MSSLNFICCFMKTLVAIFIYFSFHKTSAKLFNGQKIYSPHSLVVHFYFDKSEALGRSIGSTSVKSTILTSQGDLTWAIYRRSTCTHIIYERQLLQGLTLAIVNYTPASRCVYIFRLMWYICVGCASPYKNMLFLMYFNAFSRRYHGWGTREFPKRRMSADTPCVNNSYSARPWFTDVNQIT